jgi:prepilin-type N-terminal cleavage/methylation domain-containing protein
VNRTKGFTLIELIGVMAIMAILAAVIVPNVFQQIDAAVRDAETQNLEALGQGVEIYLRDNHVWPALLTDLSPDYVPFGDTQIAQNHRGYPRYFVVHPTIDAYDNVVGITASDLAAARFLLISDLGQDVNPTITNGGEFDTWWNTDETLTPDLKIYRGQVGGLFHLVSLSACGNGGSYKFDNTKTMSSGALLALDDMYHLTGTAVVLSEHDTNGNPNPGVEFALVSDTGYQFDPGCFAGAMWRAPACEC